MNDTSNKNLKFSPFDKDSGFYIFEIFDILLHHQIKLFERDGVSFSLAAIRLCLDQSLTPLVSEIGEHKVIQKAARAIFSNIRQVDFGARYSHDMFFLSFVNSDREEAFNIIRRILKQIGELFENTLSIDIGISTCPENGTTKDLLIQRTLDALCPFGPEENKKHLVDPSANSITRNNRPRILIVDDLPMNIKLIEGMLRPYNYDIVKALNGKDAIDLIHTSDIDLVLLDVMMPEMDGYEVCRHIKERNSTRMIPVIMVTALDDQDSRIKSIEAGADDFISKPPNKNELVARSKSLIKVRTLFKDFTNIKSVLFSLARAIEAKNRYTEGHTSRVSGLCLAIGSRMKLEPEIIEALRFGGGLHDIGKIGIPNHILNKKGPLDDLEFERVKSHSEIGFNICYPLRKRLGLAMDVIRHHHEKLDGSGYPDGLVGDEISMAARIIAAADIYDALVTDRPYRKKMSPKAAADILRDEVKKNKLDKEVVNELLYIIG